jgi:uncharacterized protein YbjQ (UPF0145 family)
MAFFGPRKRTETRDDDGRRDQKIETARETYMSGKFKIVTTENIEGREVRWVYGLVFARSYNFDTAFFGMISRAVEVGADAVLGYRESVAFHPEGEGERYYSCYGTAAILMPVK